MPCHVPVPTSMPLAPWKLVGLDGPRRGTHSSAAPCFLRYRLVGPPSTSLPTNNGRHIESKSKRRTEPFALISARSPERLARRVTVIRKRPGGPGGEFERTAGYEQPLIRKNTASAAAHSSGAISASGRST